MIAYRGRPACCPVGLSDERSSLTGRQESAEGIVGTLVRAEGLNGREESSPAVEWRDGTRRGVGQWFNAWGELATGATGEDASVEVIYYLDSICRTAGYVTRMSGGVGGERSRGLPLSRYIGPRTPRCAQGNLPVGSQEFSQSLLWRFARLTRETNPFKGLSSRTASLPRWYGWGRSDATSRRESQF
jgi:hypothetical protein